MSRFSSFLSIPKCPTGLCCLFFLGVGSSLFTACRGAASLPESHLKQTAHEALSSTESKLPAFAIKAFHLQFRPEHKSIESHHELIDQLAERGYNLFILDLNDMGASSVEVPAPGELRFVHCTAEDIAGLINHARRVGMEPVLEIKAVGKQSGILAPLLKTYPKILAEGNPRFQSFNPAFRFPDGRDVYEAIVTPLLDDLLALYGNTPARYFFLGLDEIPVEGLAKAGEEMGQSAAEVLADGLNHYTDYLLAKGITPIVFGDMLLSRRLSRPGHGVKGFDYDPRLADCHPCNAEWLGAESPSTLTAVNTIRNKDKIIIADWHYDPVKDGVFASVDYFQHLGFKDVWGVTWYNEINMAQFAKYAAERGCGGMIASVWPMFWAPPAFFRFPTIRDNSILYFNHPGMEPPAQPEPFHLKGASSNDARTVLLSPKDDTLSFSMELPKDQQPQGAEVWVGTLVKNEEIVKVPLNYDAENHRLIGQIPLAALKGRTAEHFNVGWNYRLPPDNYYMYDMRTEALVVAGPAGVPQLPLSDKGAVYWEADFSETTGADFKTGLLQVPGEFGGLLTLRGVGNRSPIPETGELDASWAYPAYLIPADGFWDAVATRGLRLTVEFRINRADQKNAPYYDILSAGRWQNLFRLMLTPNGHPEIQFGNKEDLKPIRIKTPAPIPSDSDWVTVEITLSPPNAQGNRTASIQIVGSQARTTAVVQGTLNLQRAPIGFGAGFVQTNNFTKESGIRFPGQIRRVVLRPYATE